MPIGEIRAAGAALEGIAVRTPVVVDAGLSAVTGALVQAKVEALQRSGSFKFRGAYTRLSRLVARRRPPGGVVAVSSGNHAAAVAVAARLLELEATVFMPDDAPALKRAVAESNGALVRTFDRGVADREAPARALAAELDAEFVHPFEDADIQAGQGTVALEFHEQAPGLDVLLVPMSGGGLMAGCASASATVAPGCRMVGVEPAVGDDWARSLALGERVRIDQPDTIADGLAVVSPGVATFEINRHLVDEVVTVSEAEIAAATVRCFEELKLVVEPSGAVGLAALAGSGDRFAGQRVGVVLSGGNIERDRLAAM